MFIVNLSYLKPISEVENHLEEHVEFLEKYYKLNKFIFSGRKVPRTGGVILVNATSTEEVDLILKEDPFYRNKIAQYEVTEFIITKYDDRFAAFLTKE
ncbi:YciI family protein [Paenibacillus sp. HW567]|uniref:YciI family protein n=1 Tax=Paenibacillus sp. HW567 TaxID=1034769 RepID=UPI00037B7BD9|nr:YciI family protein [Paenibacillus sp. HW567]